jgi:hypothetical protein
MIYRHIAQKYRQEVIDGIIVAVPSEVEDKSLLFSDFNIGAGAAYYERKSKNQLNVVAPCEGNDVGDGDYQVMNEKNYFYAKLHCGINRIPDVYFVGKPLHVVKVQAK